MPTRSAAKSKKPSREEREPVARFNVEELREQLREELREELAAAMKASESEVVTAAYDPRTHGIYCLATHSAVPHDMATALAHGDKGLKDAVSAMTSLASQQQTQMFTGFATNANLASDQLDKAYAYGNAQRDRGDKLQQDCNTLQSKMAEMIALSEEAKTERIRLQRDMEGMRAANDRLRMELEAKHELRVAEMENVRQFASPLMAAAGDGLMKLILTHGSQIAGAIGGAGGPGAPPTAPGAPASGTPGTRSQYEINAQGAEEWVQYLAGEIKDLKRDSAACVRALLCSYALADHGAPPPPPSLTRELLFQFIARDLGQERAVRFLQSCAPVAAYAAKEPVTPAQGASASN